MTKSHKVGHLGTKVVQLVRAHYTKDRAREFNICAQYVKGQRSFHANAEIELKIASKQIKHKKHTNGLDTNKNRSE